MSDITGTEFSDFLFGTADHDRIQGLDGDDQLWGYEGDDVLDGGDGADAMVGGIGDDAFIIAAASDYDFGELILGGEGNDVIFFTSTTSGDHLVFYADSVSGVDTIVVGSAGGDTSGTASLNVNIRFVAGDSPTVIGNDGANFIVGTPYADTFFGNGGDDTFAAGGGANFMDGGSGSDTVSFAGAPGPVSVDLAAGHATSGEGTDTLISIENVEGGDDDDLLIGSAAANRLAGMGGADTLYGLDGDDYLDGGGGPDSLVGGAGADTYVFSALDGAGNSASIDAEDRLLLTGLSRSSVAMTRDEWNLYITVIDTGASITLYSASGLAGEEGWRVTLEFGDGSVWSPENVVNTSPYLGTNGDDVLNGSEFGDQIFALGGNDVVYGNDGSDVLYGGEGDDTLDGGHGADTLIGGIGWDRYHVDDVNDVVLEENDADVDQVFSTVSYVLGANVEMLHFLGTANLDGTGNDSGNGINDNTGDNILDGGAGDDGLYGNAGNDLLLGGDGDDGIDGGAGDDTMIGGAGNDTYWIDSQGDVIVESAGDGVDTVNSIYSWTLAENFEYLVLRGNDPINGTGNDFDNGLSGNDADNILSGLGGNDYLFGWGGNDTMVGGAGDDWYQVRESGDVVIENAGEGIDVVLSDVNYTLTSNVEGLILAVGFPLYGTGNTLDNLIRGNDNFNTLAGGAGFDALEGWGGDDTLLDTDGRTYFHAGAGNDSITAGASRDFITGGTGNDSINTGGGADIIAFNVGDGQDVINPSSGVDDTLSLGGTGLSYASLSFQKVGKDLVFNVTATDGLTFKNWYQGQQHKNLLNLQVIAEAMAEFDPGSSDPLLNREAQFFDFQGLVDEFDAARTGNPGLTTWALSSALTQYHLGGSDAELFGSDLAYSYGLNGTLAGLGFDAAKAVVTAANYGTDTQFHLIGEPYSGVMRLS